MPSPTFVRRSVAALVAALVLFQAAPLRGQDVVGPSPEWQQEIGYTMEAYLDEEADVLRGAARVRYRNASPETLEWYPRVAVYDQDGWQAHPLYPQGEFYGEFATWDVTLDLAADQVVGATGVCSGRWSGRRR